MMRVYTARTARIAHLLRPEDSPNNPGARALCGAAKRAVGYWPGTGALTEQIKAASLPTCKRCDRLQGRITAPPVSESVRWP